MTNLIFENSATDNRIIQRTEAPKPPRLVSLDALRGFDMFWICEGTDFLYLFFLLFSPQIAEFLQVQFEHTAWNGFTFYDLIFPLFVFMAGLSVPFSITNRLEKGEKHTEILLHVMKRTVLLFGLGLIYNGAWVVFQDIDDMRWLGVLQRISICYLFTAIIALKFPKRGQMAILIAILFVYWIMMVCIPVPGIGAGVLTPEGNLSFYIDRLILPGSFCCSDLGDNEGILSTFPAISTCLLGAQAGHLLRSQLPQIKIVSLFLLIGVGCLGCALLWNLIFPINKLLWSSSYVLFAGGWSFILLGIFYWIIDVKGFRSWAFFFIVIGMNSIFIYMIKGLITFDFIRDFFAPSNIIDFFLKLLNITLRWLILYVMYRKKKFLKV